MSGENVPLFIMGLRLAKSNAVQYTGALLSLMAAGGTGSDVSVGPSEGSSGKSHKADAANDAVGAGPCLQRGGVREGPRCCAARVGRGALLLRNCVSAEGKLYRAPGRPRRPHCRPVCSAKNIQGKRAQSSTLRFDRGRGRRHGEKSYCKNGSRQAARRTWRARDGENLACLQHGGALDKAGRAGARACGCDRVQFGPKNSDAARETCGPTWAATQYLGRWASVLNNSAKVSSPNVEGARGMANLPCVPPKAAGKDKAPRPFFNGSGILGCARIAGAAAEEEQRRLSLLGAGVGTLSLEWARGRPNSKALWCSALLSPEPRSSKRELKLRIDEAGAKGMGRFGVIREAKKNLRRVGWCLSASQKGNPPG
ncbi:hypothetical protein ERJ75_000024400 [Trypanosoma vivax]|uniref:Uncharacterized protein n=1 Tax=Trypanosoma vivax (strain Y486) TaxID=1055687 RepID=F9WUJ3_TRYVY|nr:hypothetical protein TRVL_09804 [Trypanosoma vivax]CCD21242.1 hypothetical protein, conserved in T. vivax [Trypanosoma vivax Y486]KAH8611329.1 hypothetical protein ERJ75_000951300 [Trypanosoma vivax]KAH8611422.1 hypothetical protein ERJ75_000951000 [Trypanosoma vivax]KAH8620808.1 hypothetical protein ERJ75_000024100 [Trypanosoma vivax]|eukprot:CCD21242.1 hypothetical protein, conserved in T. vivax [Trypanosoma vivax Y486]